MTIDELLTHETITINEDRIHMLSPTDNGFELSRCNLGRFVHHDYLGRESAERLLRDAEVVFVRTEVTQ